MNKRILLSKRIMDKGREWIEELPPSSQKETGDASSQKGDESVAHGGFGENPSRSDIAHVVFCKALGLDPVQQRDEEEVKARETTQKPVVPAPDVEMGDVNAGDDAEGAAPRDSAAEGSAPGSPKGAPAGGAPPSSPKKSPRNSPKKSPRQKADADGDVAMDDAGAADAEWKAWDKASGEKEAKEENPLFITLEQLEKFLKKEKLLLNSDGANFLATCFPPDHFGASDEGDASTAMKKKGGKKTHVTLEQFELHVANVLLIVTQNTMDGPVRGRQHDNWTGEYFYATDVVTTKRDEHKLERAPTRVLRGRKVGSDPRADDVELVLRGLGLETAKEDFLTFWVSAASTVWDTALTDTVELGGKQVVWLKKFGKKLVALGMPR